MVSWSSDVCWLCPKMAPSFPSLLSTLAAIEQLERDNNDKETSPTSLPLLHLTSDLPPFLDRRRCVCEVVGRLKFRVRDWWVGVVHSGCGRVSQRMWGHSKDLNQLRLGASLMIGTFCFWCLGHLPTSLGGNDHIPSYLHPLPIWWVKWPIKSLDPRPSC